LKERLKTAVKQEKNENRDDEEQEYLAKVGWQQVAHWIEEDISKYRPAEEDSIEDPDEIERIKATAKWKEYRLLQGKRQHDIPTNVQESVMNFPFDMTALQLYNEARKIPLKKRITNTYYDHPNTLFTIESLLRSLSESEEEIIEKEEIRYYKGRKVRNVPLLPAILEEDTQCLKEVAQNLLTALSNGRIEEVGFHPQGSIVKVIGSRPCCIDRNNHPDNFDFALETPPLVANILEYLSSSEVDAFFVNYVSKTWIPKFQSSIRREYIQFIHILIDQPWNSKFFWKNKEKMFCYIAKTIFGFPSISKENVLATLAQWCNDILKESSNPSTIDLLKLQQKKDKVDELYRLLTYLLQLKNVNFKVHETDVQRKLTIAQSLQYPLVESSRISFAEVIDEIAPFGIQRFAGPILYHRRGMKQLLKAAKDDFLAERNFLAERKLSKGEFRKKRTPLLYSAQSISPLFIAFVENHNRWLDRFQQLLGLGKKVFVSYFLHITDDD
jgi:hypothetical protein